MGKNRVYQVPRRVIWDTNTFRLLLVILVSVVYAAIFLQLYPFFGAAFFILSFFPAILAGWLLGSWAGFITGAIFFPTNLVLLSLAGAMPGAMLNPSGIVGMLSVILIGLVFGRVHDLSEHLLDLNEKLLRMSKTKDEFLSLVTHDLKNPLFAILSFTDILLDGLAGTISDKQRDSISAIKRQGKVMLEMVDSLLDYTRMEFGTLVTKPEEFSLNKLLVEELEEIRVQADHKKIEISAELTQQDLELNADKQMIRRVLSNILGNAVKYTPGNGTVRLVLHPVGNSAEVIVEDSGQGISRENLSRLFDKFFVINESEAREKRSLGLGLYIARQFVLVNHGNIKAESKGLGKGSRFIINLPLSKN